MTFFDKIKTKMVEKQSLQVDKKRIVYAPIKGEIIPISEIEDGVFSEGMLGKGCGIRPVEGLVVAPFDGKIIQIAQTRHAIILESDEGIQLIIHVGMDTVKMQGKGFSPKVNIGDKVKCGQAIMEFSLPEIENAGYSSTTAVIITNTDNYKEVELIYEGMVEQKQKIIEIL